MNAAKLSISRMLKGVKSVLQLSLDDAETFKISVMFIYGIRAMIIMPVRVNRGFSLFCYVKKMIVVFLIKYIYTYL